jgi:hypothetical protein
MSRSVSLHMGLFNKNLGAFRHDEWFVDYDAVLSLKLLESNDINELLSGMYRGRTDSDCFKENSSHSPGETEDTTKYLNKHFLCRNRDSISVPHV